MNELWRPVFVVFSPKIGEFSTVSVISAYSIRFTTPRIVYTYIRPYSWVHPAAPFKSKELKFGMYTFVEISVISSFPRFLRLCAPPQLLQSELLG